jgi:tetratricopeptide (TPR) repeat protein
MGSRGVTIGRDASGNVIVTGDRNLVFPGVTALSPEVIAALQAGDWQAGEAEGAVPLPTLTLGIEFTDERRREWRVVAERPGEEALTRPGATPWQREAGFARALDDFWRLSRRVLESEEEAGLLDRQARLLGAALAGALSEDETALLVDAAHGDPPPPLLVIESRDDLILALPWELLRLDERFAVRDGRLDVARCVPVDGASVLEPPGEPVKLLINVSAPEDSGLDYEAESYFIARALHDHVGVVVNEMGEANDLVAGLCREPFPIGVHFSGHGGPGSLLFENEFGEDDPVRVDDLLTRIRRAGPKHFPRFFYLACCHGGDAPSLRADGGSSAGQSGIAATASELHRDGVTQLVAYFGAVYDRLSTWAETAFYREIAAGRLTRDALRSARQEMTRTLRSGGEAATHDAKDWSGAGSLPYGWAQMVLYQRGPDYPLGLEVEQRYAQLETETTERMIERAFIGSRTEVLRKGFVGRRTDMHALRRDLRQGKHVHVVQGLGGLGKSAFCTESLKLYEREGWTPVALWCAEVEDSQDPVGTLLQQQFMPAGEALAGEAWDGIAAAVDRAAARTPALQGPAARLATLLAEALQRIRTPLVLYLDNLESLLVGPENDDPEAHGEWRDAEAAALWGELARLARKNPSRLALLASCRYRHGDFGRAIVPFHRLPDDALWRLMGWFGSLRRLSDRSRARLVEQLAGHPRSVEFLDRLVETAIADWEEARDRELSGAGLSDEREWAEIVAPALPSLEVRLSQDLLFEALWERVLDAPSRDLLLRATVLRRPAARPLLEALHGAAAGAAAAIDRLRDASLLTELRERQTDGSVQRRFEVHPAIGRLAVKHSAAADLQAEGHRRAGDHLETEARTSRDWATDLEAAYHLREVGEIDRAFDLQAPLVQWLQDRGRTMEALQMLAGTGDPASLAPQRQAAALGLYGDVQVAQGDLAGALKSYGAGLAIRETLAAQDPGNAGWQRDLSVSHNKIGDVQVAQGDLAGALKSFGAGLAIAEKLAAQDPGNAGWQTDVVVSCVKVATVLGEDPGGKAEVRDLLQRGLHILQTLQAEGRLHGAQVEWIDGIAQMLKDL